MNDNDSEFVAPSMASIARKSLQGDMLKQIRRDQAAAAAAASDRSQQHSGQATNSSYPPSARIKLNLAQGKFFANKKLATTGFTISPSQKETPGDGNCFIHAVADQLQYDPR